MPDEVQKTGAGDLCTCSGQGSSLSARGRTEPQRASHPSPEQSGASSDQGAQDLVTRYLQDEAPGKSCPKTALQHQNKALKHKGISPENWCSASARDRALPAAGKGCSSSALLAEAKDCFKAGTQGRKKKQKKTPQTTVVWKPKTILQNHFQYHLFKA